MREAELLGGENDEGVVPLTGDLLEAIEDLPKSHAIAGRVGGRSIARRSLHEATTMVWKGACRKAVLMSREWQTIELLLAIASIARIAVRQTVGAKVSK